MTLSTYRIVLKHIWKLYVCVRENIAMYEQIVNSLGYKKIYPPKATAQGGYIGCYELYSCMGINRIVLKHELGKKINHSTTYTP